MTKPIVVAVVHSIDVNDGAITMGMTAVAGPRAVVGRHMAVKLTGPDLDLLRQAMTELRRCDGTATEDTEVAEDPLVGPVPHEQGGHGTDHQLGAGAAAPAATAATAEAEHEVSGMFLVWSNEHGAWWGPDHAGYTTVIQAAGRYPRMIAERICQQAALGGFVTRETTAGARMRVPAEVMVPDPDQSEPADGAEPSRFAGHGWD